MTNKRIAVLRARPERQFFVALWQAAPGYALAWWLLVMLRGVLPAMVSIAFGWLVSGVTRGVSLTHPLLLVGVAFTLSLILQPLHQLGSSNVGSRLAAHLYDRLMTVCVGPSGIGHLERPELTNDLTMARDFDLGMMGPPLDISMDFVAGGLSRRPRGRCCRGSAAVRVPLVGSTHTAGRLGGNALAVA